MSQVLVTESYISDIASAIRSKNGQSASYHPSQMAAAINSIVSAGDLSVISKSINTNGTYNPASDNADAFSGVVVDVPNTYSASDEGKVVISGTLETQGNLSVSSNGSYDTTLFSKVSVSIPGAILISKVISENGTYNALDDSADAYSQVVVNVSGSGGGSDGLPDMILTGENCSIINSSISILRDYAMYNHSGVSFVEMENLNSIGSYGFYGCSNLKKVIAINCISIRNNAFQRCYSLSEIDAPNCITIGSSAFDNCSSLTFVSVNSCITIFSYAFNNCKSLSSIELDYCKAIYSNAFFSCGLKSINLPSCVSIYSSAFQSCSLLQYASIPEAKLLNFAIFQYCSSLRVIWNNKATAIGLYAFFGCRQLESVYLLGDVIATLSNSNAFGNTPISISSYLGYFGSIFVPASLVEAYKSALNWSVYSDRITAYVEE